MCSQVGTRCRPPMPLMFGSTKRSESFHIGLVKSTMASSRPNTGLFSRWLGPQQSHSHSSSSGEHAQHVADGRVLHVQFRQALEGVLDGQRDEVDVGQLVGQHGDRAGQDADGVRLRRRAGRSGAGGRLLADALRSARAGSASGIW